MCKQSIICVSKLTAQLGTLQPIRFRFNTIYSQFKNTTINNYKQWIYIQAN